MVLIIGIVIIYMICLFVYALRASKFEKIAKENAENMEKELKEFFNED